MVDSVIFVYKITDNMCEWLNENQVVHNVSTRMIGWHACISLWMPDRDLIYFKLKWSDEIINEEEIEELEELHAKSAKNTRWY